MLAPENQFTFDEYSLAAISSSLRELNLQNSQVKQPKPLYYLENLIFLNLKENCISDFDEEVCPMLQTMNQLQILMFQKNPVTAIPKYRDQVVLLSSSVRELDGKDINDQERKYLVNLLNRKKIQGTVYNDMKVKKQKFMVDGEKFTIHNQKKMVLNGPRMPGHDGISFMDFKQMYGQNMTDEETWLNYMKFMEENGGLDGENQHPFGDQADPDMKKNPLANKSDIPATSIGKSKNINSNTDFTVAGVHTMNTKHVPYAVRKGGM